MDIREKMIHGVRDLLESYRGYHLYVGFSGGADSCALLRILAEIAPQIHAVVKAVHFEHGIRGQTSREDAVWCKLFCNELNVECQVIPLETPDNREQGENLEAAARRLRLEQWKLIARTAKDAVLLGHHSDDVVENVLLKLFRGGNAGSLSSLRFARRIDGVLYLRPLLNFTREEVRELLHEYKITDWREDATNDDTGHSRNYLRRMLLPELNRRFSFAVPGIRAASDALEHDADFIEQHSIDSYKLIHNQNKTPVVFWKSLHPALRQRVLGMWLSERLGRFYVPDTSVMQRFDETLEGDISEAKLIPLQGEGDILIQHEEVQISEDISVPSPLFWTWKHSSSILFGDHSFYISEVESLPENISCFEAFFDADELPDTLLIRTRLDGDRMAVFKGGSQVKVKKIFTDAGIQSIDSQVWPLLCLSSGDVIWVPGVRHSDYALIKSGTKRIIKISFATNCSLQD